MSRIKVFIAKVPGRKTTPTPFLRHFSCKIPLFSDRVPFFWEFLGDLRPIWDNLGGFEPFSSVSKSFSIIFLWPGDYMMI